MPQPSRRFLVIGLGQFGSGLARRLYGLGHEVMAIDLSRERVEIVSEDVTQALILDATDERALGGLSVEQYTSVVIAIGVEGVQHSIMATALVRQLGAPYIIGRATSPLHGRILRAVGAHEVINPEERLAELLSERMANPGLLQTFRLGENFSAAELEVPTSWVGRNLVDLDVRRRFGVNVAAVRRIGPDGDPAWTPGPGPTDPFREADVILVIGAVSDLRRLAGGRQ